jgi:hypothetical protein
MIPDPGGANHARQHKPKAQAQSGAFVICHSAGTPSRLFGDRPAMHIRIGNRAFPIPIRGQTWR